MIEKREVYISCCHENRMLHIYLPTSYMRSLKRYPVLYMLDGHNLFYDEDADFGKSWGMKTYLDSLNEDIIVVGIECNHKGNMRLEEFSPYSFQDARIGFIQGRGHSFMNWICTELKTFIDNEYRTLSNRRYTSIGGSSMGGLMSLYAIAMHNDIFSKAISLSPYLVPVYDDLLQSIQDATLLADSQIYISLGSDEYYTKNQLAHACSQILFLTCHFVKHAMQVYPNVIVNGSHTEASWEKELPIFFPLLRT